MNRDSRGLSGSMNVNSTDRGLSQLLLNEFPHLEIDMQILRIIFAFRIPDRRMVFHNA